MVNELLCDIRLHFRKGLLPVFKTLMVFNGDSMSIGLTVLLSHSSFPGACPQLLTSARIAA